MASSNPFKLLCVIVYAFLSLQIHANHVSIEFTTLAWEQTLTDLYYKEGEDMTPLTVYSRGISEPVRYDGDTNIQFWKRNTSADGVATYHIVAEINLEASTREILLVFFENPNTSGYPLIVLPLNQDRLKLPIGSCHFFNLTDKVIEGVFAEDRFTLKSNKSVIVIPPKDQTTVAVSVKLAYLDKDTWSIGYSSVWRNKPTKRLNVFVANDPTDSQHLVIKKFYSQ